MLVSIVNSVISAVDQARKNEAIQKNTFTMDQAAISLRSA
jgi:hypothetical protein